MRKPKYLSPSSIDLWQKDKREYYIKYLADSRSPKVPQTNAMTIGSAFDSYIKAHIALVLASAERREIVLERPMMVDRVSGVIRDADGVQCPLEFSVQYLSSVEPQNDGTALRDGWIVYQDYLRSGALARLMTELPVGSVVKMENTVMGFVPGTAVPLSGKPDLYCVSTDPDTGAISSVLLDWKVNGYYSKSGAYPNPAAYGIYDCRTGGYNGAGSKYGRSFEEADGTWANQLVTYSWCLGLENPHYVIDQMAYKPGRNALCARTQGRVSVAYAERLKGLYVNCWKAIEMDHIFTDMGLEESRKLCRELDTQGLAYAPTGNTSHDAYFNKVAR